MKIRQWILILLGATLLALTIRVFVLETIRVASPSMSKSQEIGDRLFIEKWSLGARLPQTLGVPFASEKMFGLTTYLTLTKGINRCHAFGAIHRNDLLAFNDPNSKTILERAPIQLSRCVGLPGESFYLNKSNTIIDGDKIPRHQDVSFCYSFPQSKRQQLSQAMTACKIHRPLYSGFVYLTRHEWFNLYRIKNQVDLGLKLRFSKFDHAQIKIPAKGSKIELNDSTFLLYGNTINKFEGVELRLDTAGNVLKNGHKVRSYTFQQNYYFLINDHLGYLNDSRTLGLIPENHIIGKAWMVFLSPSSKRFLEKI